MSYRVDYHIKNIQLTLPLNDLPLCSDIIVGHKLPTLRYKEDECAWEYIQLSISYEKDVAILDTDFHARESGYNFGYELKKLVKKYNGTLTMVEDGEESDHFEKTEIKDSEHIEDNKQKPKLGKMEEDDLEFLKNIYTAMSWRLNNGINQGPSERHWLSHQRDKIKKKLKQEGKM